MIDVKKVTEEEGLYLAHVLSQMDIADKLVSGLSTAGIEFHGYHSEGATKARAWLKTFCTDVATKLASSAKKTKLIVKPKTVKKPNKPKPISKAVKKRKVTR